MACGSCVTVKQTLREEFQLKKLLLGISNPALLTTAQWSRFPDWLFKVWKIILALYFISWLGLSLDGYSSDIPRSKNDKWMVYLTHWTYLLFTLYLLISAANSCCIGVCSGFKNSVRLLPLKFQWILWNIAATATVVVVLLYWTLLWPQNTAKNPADHTPSVMNLHVHLLNGLMLLLDQAIHAIPMHVLHVYQPMGYGAVYAVFTGVYFAANGTDPHGQTAIYSILNYGSNAYLAIGADIGVIFLVIPVVWGFLWLLHQLKMWIWQKYDTSVRESRSSQSKITPLEPEKIDSTQEEGHHVGVYVIKL